MCAPFPADGHRLTPRAYGRSTAMLLALPPKRPPRRCPHKRQKSKCVECGGRAQVPRRCEHGRQPHMCVECDGAGICRHKRQRHGCFVCDPDGRVRKARYSADRAAGARAVRAQ